MMTNTFTPFDFSISEIMNQEIIALYLYLPLICSQGFWAYPSRHLQRKTHLMPAMSKLIAPTHGTNMLGMKSLLPLIFIMMVAQNLFGLLPWGLPITAHLLASFSLALPIWLSLVLMSIMQTPPKALSHYLPEATPMNIAPLLAAIEGTSSSIRPLTLAFRLSANISAGHVILGMWGSAASATTLLLVSPMVYLLSGGAGYITFELMICIVQGFVFTLLVIMYTNDYLVPNPKHHH